MIPDWQHNCVYLADLLRDRHPSVFTALEDILSSHGIATRPLRNVRDIWARDYCPIQVMPKTIVKFQYDPDYLRNEPELKTGKEVLESLRGLCWCNRSSINLDGGNVVGSTTKAVVTDKIYRENSGWLRPDLRAKLRKLLHVDELIVIPKEPFDPIGHADGQVRFVNEDTVLVNDYGTLHPIYNERLLRVLRTSGLKVTTLPYVPENKTIRGIPSAIGCYANFLVTTNVVVAPVYGKPTDEAVLRTLETCFPKIPVVPLNCTNLAREGGALHCISASYLLPSENGDR